jgi:hypothetical protein
MYDYGPMLFYMMLLLCVLVGLALYCAIISQQILNCLLRLKQK